MMSPVGCKESKQSDSVELYYVGECENKDGVAEVSDGQCSTSFQNSKDDDMKDKSPKSSDDT